MFGTYKYLMVVFTSFGIFLASLEIIFHPNLHLYNNGFVYFTLTTPNHFSKEAMKIVLSLYTGVYSLTISLIAVQFIYRYSALFRYRKPREKSNYFSLRYLVLFRGWKSTIWIFYCSIFGGLWWIGAYFLLEMDDVSENYFKKEMLERYNAQTSDIPMLTFLAYEPKDDSIRWWDVSYMILIGIILGSQYSVMTYCGWNMYFKMEEKIQTFSVALKHHHRQLFKTLVLQITAPALFLFSPIVIISSLTFFHLEVSFPAGVAICAFSFYPALDSVIVLIVVTEYRVVARRMWMAMIQKTSFTRQLEVSSTTNGQIELSTITRSVMTTNGMILIFLTLFGVRKIYGPYKYIMIIFTSLGIPLAALETIFHPNLHFYNSGWVFFTLTLPFGSSKITMEKALGRFWTVTYTRYDFTAVYAGVYSLTISLIAVQFIYRYWTLFKIRCLTYFDGWRSLIWVFYCLLFAVSWGIGACHLLEMDTTSEDYFSEEMFLRYNASSSATPMLTFLAYDPGYGCLRYRNFLYLVLISTVMGFQYTVMWYCGYRMYIKMEEKIAGFSRALRNHHRQLFKTLVLQITAPTIFLFSPLIPIMFLPFFQLELNFPAGAAFSAFSFYPAFDSIIVLLVVKEYRQVARRTFATVLLNILSREQGSVRTYSFPMTSLAVSTVM